MPAQLKCDSQRHCHRPCERIVDSPLHTHRGSSEDVCHGKLDIHRSYTHPAGYPVWEFITYVE